MGETRRRTDVEPDPAGRPIAAGAADAKPVQLTGAGPTNAQRALLPKGTGYFVQVTGQQPTSTTKESVFWISDLGVRYGMEAAQTPGAGGSPAEALGMTAEPLPIPWSLLSLFRPRPHLVQRRCAGSALTEDQQCERDSLNGDA